jgi:hypothetical protein
MEEGIKPTNFDQEKLLEFLSQVFWVDLDGKLQYQTSITDGVVYENMHSPLSQLCAFLYQWGQVTPPNPADLIEKITAPQYQPIAHKSGRHDVFLEAGFSSCPSGIFSSLEIARAKHNEEADSVLSFREKIAQMDSVLLLGAISPVSIFEAVRCLENFGFKGTMTIVDLSSISINIAQKLHASFPLSGQAKLEFKTHDATTDLNDFLGSKTFDLVITDILGIYLSHQNYKWSTTNIYAVLKDDGYFLTREMTEPYQETGVREKTVGIRSNEEELLLSFVQKLFPEAKYSIYEIANFFKTRWPNTIDSRKEVLQYVAEISHQLEILSHVVVVPSEESERLFETILMRKHSSALSPKTPLPPASLPPA